MGSKSILNLCSDLSVYPEDECVNISLKSSSLLGRMLSPKWSSRIKMELGTFGSVNNFMDYISIPNYPAKFKSKSYVSLKELSGLEKRRSVANFYALTAWAIATRIANDKELIEMIKKNELPYTSMIIRKVNFLEKDPEKKVHVWDINSRMGRYVGIIRTIAQDLKSGNALDSSYIERLVTSCKDKPDLHLLHGVAFAPEL